MTSSIAPPAVPPSTPAGRALLFGLNYTADAANRLSGCINDVNNVAAFLRRTRPGIVVDVYDDVSAYSACTRQGMVSKLNALVDAVNADPTCEYVWVHYSGHGTSVRDTSGDEGDGRDECLVPVDFQTAGFLVDDDLVGILGRFQRPTTKVVCVMDSCHSGTVCDLKYRWASPTSAVLDTSRAGSITAKAILLSGCTDAQTSADAYGVLKAPVSGRPEAGGALTGCLLNVLQAAAAPRDAFAVQQAVAAQLAAGGFPQRPVLTSSFNLSKDLLLV